MIIRLTSEKNYNHNILLFGCNYVTMICYKINRHGFTSDEMIKYLNF